MFLISGFETVDFSWRNVNIGGYKYRFMPHNAKRDPIKLGKERRYTTDALFTDGIKELDIRVVYVRTLLEIKVLRKTRVIYVHEHVDEIFLTTLLTTITHEMQIILGSERLG